MQCVGLFFEKGIHSVKWGKAQEAGKFSRIFVLKVTLQKKIGGAGCTSCSPNNFVGGALAPPSCSPRFPSLCKQCRFFSFFLFAWYWSMLSSMLTWVVECFVLLLAHGLHPESCCSTRQGAPLFPALYVSATAEYYSEGELLPQSDSQLCAWQWSSDWTTCMSFCPLMGMKHAQERHTCTSFLPYFKNLMQVYAGFSYK